MRRASCFITLSLAAITLTMAARPATAQPPPGSGGPNWYQIAQRGRLQLIAQRQALARQQQLYQQQLRAQQQRAARQQWAAQQALARQRWVNQQRLMAQQRWAARRQWNTQQAYAQQLADQQAYAQQLAAQQQTLAEQQAYAQGLTEGRRDDLQETMARQPITPDDASTQDEQHRVTLTNPDRTGETIRFSIDGSTYRLGSGKTRVLCVRSSSLIKFDRGEGSGQALDRLPEGAYQFVYDDEQGWDLKQAANPPAP